MDVREAMSWLFTFSSSSAADDENIEEENEGEKPRNHSHPNLADTNGVILVGHSVGATIAFGVALGLGLGDHSDGEEALSKNIKAVVGVEGIYDFTALRDAHWGYRDVYEEFTSGAFGEEKTGAWERGNVGRMVREGAREMEEGVEVVVLGQSRGDGLVEWGQVEGMERALRERDGWREGGEGVPAKEVTVLELEGGHDEVWERGEGLARCITVAVERCVRRDLGGGCSGYRGMSVSRRLFCC